MIVSSIQHNSPDIYTVIFRLIKVSSGYDSPHFTNTMAMLFRHCDITRHHAVFVFEWVYYQTLRICP